MNTYRGRAYGKVMLRQALLWQLGRCVPYGALEDVIWGGDEDGGPLYSKHIIHKYTYQLRKEGHAIETWRGVGLKMRRETA